MIYRLFVFAFLPVVALFSYYAFNVASSDRLSPTLLTRDCGKSWELVPANTLVVGDLFSYCDYMMAYVNHSQEIGVTVSAPASNGGYLNYDIEISFTVGDPLLAVEHFKILPTNYVFITKRVFINKKTNALISLIHGATKEIHRNNGADMGLEEFRREFEKEARVGLKRLGLKLIGCYINITPLVYRKLA